MLDMIHPKSANPNVLNRLIKMCESVDDLCPPGWGFLLIAGDLEAKGKDKATGFHAMGSLDAETTKLTLAAALRSFVEGVNTIPLEGLEAPHGTTGH